MLDLSKIDDDPQVNGTKLTVDARIFEEEDPILYDSSIREKSHLTDEPHSDHPYAIINDFNSAISVRQ